MAVLDVERLVFAGVDDFLVLLAAGFGSSPEGEAVPARELLPLDRPAAGFFRGADVCFFSMVLDAVVDGERVVFERLAAGFSFAPVLAARGRVDFPRPVDGLAFDFVAPAALEREPVDFDRPAAASVEDDSGDRPSVLGGGVERARAGFGDAVSSTGRGTSQ